MSYKSQRLFRSKSQFILILILKALKESLEKEGFDIFWVALWNSSTSEDETVFLKLCEIIHHFFSFKHYCPPIYASRFQI